MSSGFVDVIASAVDAKRAVREANGASREAMQAEAALRGGQVGANCAGNLDAERQALQGLVQLAAMDPDAFRHMVRKTQETFLARLKHDLGELLADTSRLSARIARNTFFREVVHNAETFKQSRDEFRVRYLIELEKEEQPIQSFNAVIRAADGLVVFFDSWGSEQQAAGDLAAAKATAARYRGISSPSLLDRANVDESERRLRDAQQQYEWAKSQLAAKRDSVARLVSEAMRVAKDGQEQAPQDSVEARNP